MNLLVRAMLGLCAALALVIGAEYALLRGGPGTSPATPTEAAAGEAVPTVRPQGMPPFVSFSNLLQRPLFTDTRRPPPAAATGTRTSLPSLAARWTLTGVVVAGEQSHIFLQGNRDRSVQRLQVGMQIDGWTLTGIAAEEARFEAGSRVEALLLRDDTS